MAREVGAGAKAAGRQPIDELVRPPLRFGDRRPDRVGVAKRHPVHVRESASRARSPTCDPPLGAATMRRTAAPPRRARASSNPATATPSRPAGPTLEEEACPYERLG